MGSEERLRDAGLTATAFDAGAAGDPPARARAVVVGGGIIGASVAYHLARLGWTDTVVLERSRVSSGTSWHAAGLMTRTRGTHAQTELASYSRDFYRDLAALSGIDVGYYPNGSLSVARTRERLTELRYAVTMARHHGLPAVELEPRRDRLRSLRCSPPATSRAARCSTTTPRSTRGGRPSPPPRPPTTSGCASSKACA